jgi:hypothetical protein
MSQAILRVLAGRAATLVMISQAAGGSLYLGGSRLRHRPSLPQADV